MRLGGMPEIDEPAPGKTGTCDGSGRRWGLVVNPNVLEAERKRNSENILQTSGGIRY